MARDLETILTIHGLEGDMGLVRADVFSRKLRAFLAGLAEADKLANGKRAHRFMIEGMQKSSAKITVREKQATREPPKASGVAAYERALKAVYNGDRSVDRLPPRLVTSIRALSVGAEKDFAHGEVSFDVPDNVVRIDDFLRRQSERAKEVIAETASAGREPFFQGIAIGSFDGILKVLDSRGQTISTKLITTAGAVEIDCIVNRSQLSEAKDHFEQRVRVEGAAHYDGTSALPVRVDVHSITPVKVGAAHQTKCSPRSFRVHRCQRQCGGARRECDPTGRPGRKFAPSRVRQLVDDLA